MNEAHFMEGEELNHTKLTKWKKEPSLKDLKSDLTEALSDHHVHTNQIKTWLNNLNVTGSAKPKKIPGKSSVQPKLIRKQAEWRYAALSEPFLSTEDIFNTEPVTHEDRIRAFQNGLVLNQQFNMNIDKVAFIDEYIRTAVDEGSVVCRTGWHTKEEEVEVEVPIIEYTEVIPSEEQAQFEAELHRMMEEEPDSYEALAPEVKGAHELYMEEGVFYIGEVVGTELQKEMQVTENHPTVEVCDYNDIIVDPTAKGDEKKIQFVIYRFETSIAELKESGINYQNLDDIKMENSSPLNQPDNYEQTTTFQFQDKARKKLVAHEYWGYYDIHGIGTTVPIVVTWVGNTIIRMEENPFPDKEVPFVFVSYLPVRKSIYGEPDGELLEDNQKIVGAVTRGMVDLMARSANGQIGIRQDALDVTNKRRYNAGLDYEFNPNIDPRNAIIHHEYPEIPNSAQLMINLQNADAESLTGVKSFSQDGITGKALGETVGGQRNALDAAAMRKLGILRRLATGMKKIGRKFMAMNAEFMSDVEQVRITNGTFIPVRRDDLGGKYDIRLAISTAEADNEKAQELAFMLQTMGNNLDFNMSKMILSDIARLRKMPGLAKRIEEFEPQPDPLAVEKAQLEIELLKAQIENERAKGQENAVDVELKSAKAETERAKTRGLHSKADKDDLDFLEQEAGIPHERELEKQDNDRLANLDLKVLEQAIADKEKSQQQASGQSL